MDDYLVEEIQVSDEYLKAIGRMMVNWNQLDAIFDLLIVKLMGCRMWDMRSHVPIVDLNFGNKLEIAKSLASLQLADGFPYLTKLLNETFPKLSTLQGKRNAVAHYKWMTKGEAVSGIRVKAKGKVTMTAVPVSLEDLHAYSAQMLSLMDEIFRMIPLEEFMEGYSTHRAK